MFCSTCGTEQKSGSKFCPTCGSKNHLSRGKRAGNAKTFILVISALVVLAAIGVSLAFGLGNLKGYLPQANSASPTQAIASANWPTAGTLPATTVLDALRNTGICTTLVHQTPVDQAQSGAKDTQQACRNYVFEPSETKCPVEFAIDTSTYGGLANTPSFGSEDGSLTLAKLQGTNWGIWVFPPNAVDEGPSYLASWQKSCSDVYARLKTSIGGTLTLNHPQY
jgi:hypothetical protein